MRSLPARLFFSAIPFLVAFVPTHARIIHGGAGNLSLSLIGITLFFAALLYGFYVAQKRGLFGGEVKLHAVARREDDRFADRSLAQTSGPARCNRARSLWANRDLNPKPMD